MCPPPLVFIIDLSGVGLIAAVSNVVDLSVVDLSVVDLSVVDLIAVVLITLVDMIALHKLINAQIEIIEPSFK